MTSEAGRGAQQVRLDDVIDAAMAGVARAIATHGTVPGVPPVYVGIVAEEAREMAQAAAAPVPPHRPVFVGIVAEGVRTTAQAQAQLSSLPQHRFIGISVQKLDPANAQEMGQALTNVNRELT